MRRITFYTTIIILLSFGFRRMDGWEIDALQPGIGQLLWLITPLIVALIFHYSRKEKANWGLSLRLKGNWYWYLFSLLIFPLLFGLLTETGIALNSIEQLQPLWTSTFGLAVLIAIPAQFLKNIFEEFVWRGFLFAQLEKQKIVGLKNHLIIGFIWAIWHIPYVDGFAQLYHNMSWQIYLPLFLVGVIVTAIIYGEIRRRSGTVWTAVLLHTIANAFVNVLFLKNYIELKAGKEWWIAPATDNLGYIILMGAVGWLLLKKNK